MDAFSEVSHEPRYSIGEVSELTGISAYTLRYYDKCGFFPELHRERNRVRSFSDNDLAWLGLVDSLRKSGLSIEGIQYFVRLTRNGEQSRYERQEILQAQITTLEYQLEEIRGNLNILKNHQALLSSTMER